MITHEQAARRVWQAAEKYLAMCYVDLLEVARRQTPAENDSHWAECERREVYFDIHIAAWGLLRKRVSVELIMSAGGEDEGQSLTVIVYFERFRNGRLAGPWGPDPVPEQYRK